MSAYSTGPADDFDVWESHQLFDFPEKDHSPESRALETGLSFTASLLGARRQREVVGIDTVGGRSWRLRPRAVGRTWFSGMTDTPERGVVVSLAAIVECRSACPPDDRAGEVDVSLSRAIAVTAQRTRTVRVTTPGGFREGELHALGTDYLSLTRGALDGVASQVTIPFSNLVAVVFLEAGDIS